MRNAMLVGVDSTGQQFAVCQANLSQLTSLLSCRLAKDRGVEIHGIVRLKK